MFCYSVSKRLGLICFRRFHFNPWFWERKETSYFYSSGYILWPHFLNHSILLFYKFDLWIQLKFALIKEDFFTFEHENNRLSLKASNR